MLGDTFDLPRKNYVTIDLKTNKCCEIKPPNDHEYECAIQPCVSPQDEHQIRFCLLPHKYGRLSEILN